MFDPHLIEKINRGVLLRFGWIGTERMGMQTLAY